MTGGSKNMGLTDIRMVESGRMLKACPKDVSGMLKKIRGHVGSLAHVLLQQLVARSVEVEPEELNESRPSTRQVQSTYVKPFGHVTPSTRSPGVHEMIYNAASPSIGRGTWIVLGL